MPTTFAMEIAVEPKNRNERSSLRSVLDAILEQHSTLARVDGILPGQFVIRGNDERHLEAAVEKLRHEFGHQLGISAPQAAYCEKLEKKVDVDYTLKKQSGNSGQFGRIKFTVEPGAVGQGVVFKDEVPDGNIPKCYIPSIEKGIREVAETGSLLGFPIIDFTATLYDGAYHNTDSSAVAFESAARGGMREAAQKAGVKLMEPIMKVVVLTPKFWLDRIVANLSERRGNLQYQTAGDACVIVALAPMAQLFGYDPALANLSQGEARFAMLFDHYGEVPCGIADPDPRFPAAAALRA